MSRQLGIKGDQREPLIKKFDQRVKELFKKFLIHVEEDRSVLLAAENWVEVYEGSWPPKKKEVQEEMSFRYELKSSANQS